MQDLLRNRASPSRLVSLNNVLVTNQKVDEVNFDCPIPGSSMQVSGNNMQDAGNTFNDAGNIFKYACNHEFKSDIHTQYVIWQ